LPAKTLNRLFTIKFDPMVPANNAAPEPTRAWPRDLGD